MTDLGEVIVDARCKLINDDPWYGSMASMFEWVESTEVPTMGVCFTGEGTVRCYYNVEFTEKLEFKEIMAVLRHEIEHVVRLHPYRGFGVENHNLMNIAMDMVVNGKKNSPHIRDLPDKCVYMPEDMDGNLTAEEVYELLLTNEKYKKQFGNGEGFGFDDHSKWGSDIDYDVARQMVKDMVGSARQAGKEPGHLSQVIERLNQPTVDWRSELRRFIARQVGGKRHTWARQNRRRQEFGIKGRSTHASTNLTLMLDTSGSVSDKMLEQFFAEMESISQRFEITLMQFDHGYQCHSPYKRGDWRSLKVQGRGGTSFIDAFKALEEKHLVGAVNIVLTDGEASWPTPAPPYPVIWAIMCHGQDESIKPPFGDVIYIKEKKG